jgi:4-hydroxy-tetrahydrodipicolinate reductase
MPDMNGQIPRIALIGYGKMGKSIHRFALERDISIAAIIDPNFAEYAVPMNAETLQSVDVCIDCTTPESVMNNIRRIAPLKKNLIIGTTGWTEHVDEVRAIAAEHQIGLLYASNFSIGMHLFIRIVSEAAKMFSRYEAYDVAVHETHHTLKKDAPSGTAFTIAEKIMAQIPAKKTCVTGNKEGALRKDELHVSSLRLGATPGVHSVQFDGSSDTIELKHTARDRNGLAEGALLAARWIYGKKGLFTIEDMINDIESV